MRLVIKEIWHGYLTSEARILSIYMKMKIRICGNIMAVTGAAIVDHSLLFVVNFVLFTHFGPRDQFRRMKLKRSI